MILSGPGRDQAGKVAGLTRTANGDYYEIALESGMTVRKWEAQLGEAPQTAATPIEPRYNSPQPKSET